MSTDSLMPGLFGPWAADHDDERVFRLNGKVGGSSTR